MATMQVSEGLAVGGQVGGGLCRAPIAYCGRRGDLGPLIPPTHLPVVGPWLPPCLLWISVSSSVSRK